MAQGPDYKEGELPCEIPFIISNKNPDPWAKGGILRPKGWTNNPYKGKDGKDYHTLEALQEADRRFKAGRIIPEFDLGEPYNNLNELKFPIILLNKLNYLNTPELDLRALAATAETFLGRLHQPPLTLAERLRRREQESKDLLRAFYGECDDPLLEPVL